MVDFENKCIICGETLEKTEDKVSCPKCHFEEQNQVSKTDMGVLAEAFDSLANADFDMAYEGFFKFVKKHSDLSIGYFGLVLAKYYVREYSLESVTVSSVKNDCVLNDVDYISAVKYARGETRDFIINVARLIEEKSVSVVSSAIEYKPYEIAVLGDKEGEVYNYLSRLGYDTYSSEMPSDRDYLIDEFNVKTNAKMLVVVANTEEDLVKLSKNAIVQSYVNSLQLKSVKDGTLIVVSGLSSKTVSKVIPEATLLDESKKTLLFDIETVAKTHVREIAAPQEKKVKVKDSVTKDSSLNERGFRNVIRGIGLAGLVILLAEYIMYTFTGVNSVVLGIGLGFAGVLMTIALVLSIVVYVRASRSTMYMLSLIISAVLVITSAVGLCSIFISNGGSSWCYRGYWYVESEDKTVSVTNVDFYYTFFHRNVVIPETIKGLPVTDFTLQNHAEIYAVSSVSENLERLTIYNCGSLKEVLVSVMSLNFNSVSITDCKKLQTISIKNSEAMTIELKNLESLNTLILKGIKTIEGFSIDSVGLSEMWLPEELERLTTFSISNVSSMDIYTLHGYDATIRPALSTQAKWTGNGYKHPNDPDSTSKAYNKYVYPKTSN